MSERKVMLKRVLIAALVVSSLIFITRIFLNSPVSWQTVTELTSVSRLLLALVPCILMLVSKSILHAMLVEDIHGQKTPWSRIIASYAQAQLIRYLPGKVWGIIYQGEQLAGLVSRTTVWTANIVQVVLTNLNTLGVVLGFCGLMYLNVVAAAVVFAGFAAVCAWTSMSGIMPRLVVLLAPKSAGAVAIPAARPSLRRVAAQMAILQIEWVFYYVAWIVLLGNQTSLQDILIISTSYAAASFVGLLVVVMPSGWLVREAVFIWLGDIQGLGADQLLVLSVVMRLFFIAGDFLCAVVLFFCSLLAKRN